MNSDNTILLASALAHFHKLSVKITRLLILTISPNKLRTADCISTDREEKLPAVYSLSNETDAHKNI